MLNTLHLEAFYLVHYFVYSCLEFDWYKNGVALPMWFVDIDFHEFNVFHLSLKGISGPEYVLVEFCFNGVDVSSTIFFILTEGLFHNLVNFTFDEVVFLQHDRHHLGIEAWKFVVEGIQFKSNSFCQNIQSLHGLSSGIVCAVYCVGYYILEIILGIRV